MARTAPNAQIAASLFFQSSIARSALSIVSHAIGPFSNSQIRLASANPISARASLIGPSIVSSEPTLPPIATRRAMRRTLTVALVFWLGINGDSLQMALSASTAAFRSVSILAISSHTSLCVSGMTHLPYGLRKTLFPDAKFISPVLNLIGFGKIDA
jgi:hypothetical protein